MEKTWDEDGKTIGKWRCHDILWDFMGFDGIYPLVSSNMAGKSQTQWRISWENHSKMIHFPLPYLITGGQKRNRTSGVTSSAELGALTKMFNTVLVGMKSKTSQRWQPMIVPARIPTSGLIHDLAKQHFSAIDIL